ncbi:MAG: hypothetical protein DRP97_01380 [Candidatus Latescibacterota bacterium]|nr:MAG: hypothetical protein DRP97_01380 [Candidatus Latescibacterota bacterium]
MSCLITTIAPEIETPPSQWFGHRSLLDFTWKPNLFTTDFHGNTQKKTKLQQKKWDTDGTDFTDQTERGSFGIRIARNQIIAKNKMLQVGSTA